MGCGGGEQVRKVEPEIESTIRAPQKPLRTMSERVDGAGDVEVKPTLAQPRPQPAFQRRVAKKKAGPDGQRTVAPTAVPVTPTPTPPPSPKGPERYDSWATYQLEHRYDCAGRLDILDPPFEFTIGENTGTIHGHRMDFTLGRTAKPRSVRVGVLSGPKDTSDNTMANIDYFLEWFKKRRVDLVVVNGDIGYAPNELEETMTRLATSGFLVVVSAGNADANVPFNRAARDVSAQHPNLINGNLVRLIDVGPVSLLVLPGYHDPMFVSPGDGCQYYREDLADHAKLAAAAKGKPVLVAHGPPRGGDEKALDYAFDAGNVGDTALNRFIDAEGVNVGIFGHILEAGGRAVDPATGRRLKANTWSDQLWINAGCATSLVTELHDGTKHAGMAAVVEVDGRRARYWLKRRKPPEE